MNDIGSCKECKTESGQNHEGGMNDRTHNVHPKINVSQK